MKEQKILDFARESIYDQVKYIGKWKKYDVWEPGFSDGEPRFIGFPQFILVKDGEPQWSADDEQSREIMNALWK